MTKQDGLFNEFPIPGHQEWKDKLKTDLKGKSFEDLIHEDENGFRHAPFYQAKDIDASCLAAIQAAQRLDLDWEIIESQPLVNDAYVDHLRGKELRLSSYDECQKIQIDGRYYKSLGANINNELLGILQHVLGYLDHYSESGHAIDQIANKLEIHLAFGLSYFNEIAKTRALRYLLSEILKAYKVEAHLRIVGHGSMYYLSHLDAHTNLLRTSSQAMSAVIGGCDAIYVPAFDAIENSSERGERWARNIQLILKEEAHFNKIIDPGSGAYYIEHLTLQIVESVWKLFLEVESQGGFLTLHKNGDWLLRFEENKKDRLDQYQKDEKTLIGVNQFQNEKGVKLKTEENTLSKEIEI